MYMKTKSRVDVEMTVPHALVNRFFQLVNQRQFAGAERELQRIKERMGKNEWNNGYYTALWGIMISTKMNNDQYVFLRKLDLSDKKTLQKHRKEFLHQVNNRLYSDYDRGFFSAWADYMRLLLKTRWKPKTENINEKPVEKRVDTASGSRIQKVPKPLKPEKSSGQTDIFQFLAPNPCQGVEKNPENKP